MGPAAAIGSADCPATGLLATAAAEADKLDHDILDAMIQLFRQILAQSEKLAERYGVPLFCVKALHILDTSMAMKELGQRMGCDPSFVTAIADTLEKKGLARREASAADRRVKNLVLSTDGIELKGRLEKEMLTTMPWSVALDTAERETFLGLVRKLTAAVNATGTTVHSPATPSGSGRAGEVSDS
jgi:DNA-binding MarR family transcriptional regulator